MKNGIKFWIYSFAIMGVFLIFITSCKKTNDNNDPTPTPGTVTDIDGNVYHTVSIGTQIWMVENLRTTKYLNGDPIPKVVYEPPWHILTSGAFCMYNDNPTVSDTYGHLYNWYAVNDIRKIAPNGWHVPTKADWDTLIYFLGSIEVGGKLKSTGNIEAGTGLWYVPNEGSTNSSGFTALPGGRRSADKWADWVNLGYQCTFWSSTEIHATGAHVKHLTNTSNNLGGLTMSKNFGYSVRCVKD